jgi:hypothetical protein
MKIGGPFPDPKRKKAKKKWFLSYFVPRLDSQGAPILHNGKPVLARKRPYYESKDAAQEDKPRILAQYGAGGNSPSGILTREQASEYSRAKDIVPEIPLPDVARFYRLHHPLRSASRIKDFVSPFLDTIETRSGKTKQWEDLKSRTGIFSKTFGERIPETITRKEIMDWLLTYPGRAKSPRTLVNLKQSVCNFLNWLRDNGILSNNPAGGIKRRMFPKYVTKEISVLRVDQAETYLRACERYDPELVAHEIIQLVAGVRADDEMANFRGDWVFPETREIVIPAAIAKTEKREVIDSLEDSFWEWWTVYGRKGLLRPPNINHRWTRIRTLARVADRARADEIARLPMRKLVLLPEAVEAVRAWPWNARRRTFATHHIAKHQSADLTVLIMRHRGDTYTLHNSYRGMGVTQQQGIAYFSILPAKIDAPIFPPVASREPRGAVRMRIERKLAREAAAARCMVTSFPSAPSLLLS